MIFCFIVSKDVPLDHVLVKGEGVESRCMSLSRRGNPYVELLTFNYFDDDLALAGAIVKVNKDNLLPSA